MTAEPLLKQKLKLNICPVAVELKSGGCRGQTAACSDPDGGLSEVSYHSKLNVQSFYPVSAPQQSQKLIITTRTGGIRMYGLKRAPAQGRSLVALHDREKSRKNPVHRWSSGCLKIRQKD